MYYYTHCQHSQLGIFVKPHRVSAPFVNMQTNCLVHFLQFELKQMSIKTRIRAQTAFDGSSTALSGSWLSLVICLLHMFWILMWLEGKLTVLLDKRWNAVLLTSISY